MQTVCKWEQAGLPVARPGGRGRATLYDEAEVRAWLHAREEAGTRADGPLDLVQERARKEHWQALVAEQTFRTRERELLPRDEVERVWSARRDAIRTKMLAIPTSYADALHRAATLEGAAGVERALKEMVYEVLRELAEPAGEGKGRT